MKITKIVLDRELRAAQQVTMRLTRETLFEAVWDSPRKRLAQHWGLNANTITAACKLHRITLPPRAIGRRLKWKTHQAPTTERLKG